MIRKTLRKVIAWAMREREDDELEVVSSKHLRRRNIVTTSGDSEYLRSQSMSFNLYAAEGGTVIETNFYDDKTDRQTHRLYLIAEGEDFTNSLGQIISMERLKSWH
jgi:hypothetical protein